MGICSRKTYAGRRLLVITYVAQAIIFLSLVGAQGETLHFPGTAGSRGWWYTDESYGSNTDGSVMLAGQAFLHSENASDIPVYFFCTSEPAVWKDNDGNVVSKDSTVPHSRVITHHWTLLFQPPLKYAVSGASGLEYHFTLYSDVGKWNLRAAASADGRASRVELSNNIFDHLYRTRDRLSIGYGEHRSDTDYPAQAWSDFIGFDGRTFGQAFRFFIKRCSELALGPVSPPPPPP
jgi:hypothetical protein